MTSVDRKNSGEKKSKICSSPNNTGQFQQAPAVPISDTPDPKKKVKTKLKRKTSAFPNYLKTAFKNVFNRRGVAEWAKKAAKNWHELSQEEKRTYADNNKNKNNITKLSKQRTDKQVLQNDIKRRLTIKEIRTYGLRRGLINIKNDCWLNALKQCLATTPVGEMGRIDEGCNAPLLLVHLIRTICKIKNCKNAQPYYSIRSLFITNFIRDFKNTYNKMYEKRLQKLCQSSRIIIQKQNLCKSIVLTEA